MQKRLIDDTKTRRHGASEQKDVTDNRHVDRTKYKSRRHHVQRRSVKVGDDEINDHEAVKLCAAGVKAACRQPEDIIKQQQQPHQAHLTHLF